MMQIFDTFADILAVLEDLLSLTTILVILQFLALIFLAAISRNIKQKIVKPYRPNILRRLYRRLRKRKTLPTADKKELAEP